MGVEAPVICANHRYGLALITGRHTAFAKDTFVVIANHVNGTIIEFPLVVFTVVVVFIIDVELFTQLLQFTIATANTREAFSLMSGQDQLQGQFAGIKDSLGIGDDFHTFANRINTSRDEVFDPFYFHDANPTGTDFVDFFQVTQRRNIDIVFPRCL